MNMKLIKSSAVTNILSIIFTFWVYSRYFSSFPDHIKFGKFSLLLVLVNLIDLLFNLYYLYYYSNKIDCKIRFTIDGINLAWNIISIFDKFYILYIICIWYSIEDNNHLKNGILTVYLILIIVNIFIFFVKIITNNKND